MSFQAASPQVHRSRIKCYQAADKLVTTGCDMIQLDLQLCGKILRGYEIAKTLQISSLEISKIPYMYIDRHKNAVFDSRIVAD